MTLLEGTVDGIPYRVETWILRRIAVLIDLPQYRMRLPSLFCTTYWGPFIPDDGKWGQEEAQRIFDLGATSVGVGCMSNTIDVTFERDGMPLTRQRVEEAVRVMAILRRRALGECE